MRCAARSTIPVALVLLAGACAGPTGQQVRRIEDTRDILPDSDFSFTLSPDDRWLVFFTRVDDQSRNSRHHHYGNLHILDLRTGDLRLVTVPEDQGPEAIVNGEACWKPDSSECLLPPPQSLPPAPPPAPPPESTANTSPRRGLLIRFSKSDEPRVIPILFHQDSAVRIEVPGEAYKAPAQLTCSDCFLNANDVELIKQRVDEKYLRFDEDHRNSGESTMQIVSPDRTKIFFQKRPEKTAKRGQVQEVALYELDLTSGKERRLVAFRDEYPTIDHLRPSPDGTRLAYQLTTGFGALESRPNIYVLDLKTLGNRHIATADGDQAMHWNRASDKLYFYCQNYLYVASIPQPKPRATTRPR